MKKYLYLTAALAIVGAVSCNKEISDNTTPDAPEVKLATLTATIGEPGTKTTLATPEDAHTNGSKTYWCAEDRLSVFDGENNVEYSVKESENYEAAEAAVFEGAELADAEAYYALYPYTEAATLEDGTIKGAVLPAEQTAVAGNIPEGAALAAAYTEDRSEVRFKNVATTIGFTLTEAAEKVEFIAKGGQDIAGTIDITFDGEGLPTYEVQDGTGSNTVTLTDLAAGTYYFTILPDVTLTEGYELKIDDVLAKTGAVGATLKRSMIYSLTTVAPLAERNLAFSEDAVTATYGEDFTEPVLSGVTDGVTYESSNTEVATVDPSTGEVTLLAAGTTIIKATASENETHLEGSASYTLTVTPNRVRLYVESEKTEFKMNIYFWGIDDVIATPTWPGTPLSWDESEHKYYYDFPLDLLNKDLDFLINVNGDEYKSADYKITFDAFEKSQSLNWKWLYLKPNSNWKQAGARFAAYFFDNGDTWISMTKLNDDFYGVRIPTDKSYPKVIFCRMNPSSQTNGWDADTQLWNQTNDLTIPTDGKNLYTVADGAWSKGSGTWSTK